MIYWRLDKETRTWLHFLIPKIRSSYGHSNPLAPTAKEKLTSASMLWKGRTANHFLCLSSVSQSINLFTCDVSKMDPVLEGKQRRDLNLDGLPRKFHILYRKVLRRNISCGFSLFRPRTRWSPEAENSKVVKGSKWGQTPVFPTLMIVRGWTEGKDSNWDFLGTEPKTRKRGNVRKSPSLLAKRHWNVNKWEENWDFCRQKVSPCCPYCTVVFLYVISMSLKRYNAAFLICQKYCVEIRL